jgi:acyl-CoA dehydrogenase
MPLSADQEADLLAKLEDFAKTHIRPIRETLLQSENFPEMLWKAFCDADLPRLSLPTEYGGQDASFNFLSKAGFILNQHGGVPGATMTFMTHWMFSRLHIAAHASETVKAVLMPRLASGQSTLSVAISEPGAGAHPKYLKTAAVKSGAQYAISGEKAFLTNGPIADYFIVLAITGENQDRKEFSAILVPADCEGLTRTDGIKVDFLYPSAHGGISLDNCLVPTENVIGELGNGFVQTSMRTRVIEDAVGAAGLIGSLKCLLGDLVQFLEEGRAATIGSITAQLEGLEVIAGKLAELASDEDSDLTTIQNIQLSFREIVKSNIAALQEISDGLTQPLPQATKLLLRDITKFHAIAGSVHQTRLTQLGLKLTRAPLT